MLQWIVCDLCFIMSQFIIMFINRACSERTNDYTSRYNGAHTDRPAVVPITYWKNIEARSVISYCCSFLDNIITYVTISSWDVTLNRSIFFNLKLVFNVTKCRRVSDTYTRYTPYRIQVPNLKTNYVYDTYWDMKCIIYFWLSLMSEFCLKRPLIIMCYKEHFTNEMCFFHFVTSEVSQLFVWPSSYRRVHLPLHSRGRVLEVIDFSLSPNVRCLDSVIRHQYSLYVVYSFHYILFITYF